MAVECDGRPNWRVTPGRDGVDSGPKWAARRGYLLGRLSSVSGGRTTRGPPAISREELYTAAVGERAARYYAPKFLAFEEGMKRLFFNVWALLFGAFWFCYRRMWISALV